MQYFYLRSKNRKFNKIKYIIIVTIITCLFLSCSDYHNSINVSQWQILHVQNNSLNSILNEKGWQPIRIPSKFKIKYQSVENIHYAWLKGGFIIYDDPSYYYGISLGRIHHTDSVYINNRLIDFCNADEFSNIHMPRNYIIPENVIRKGKNEIYIRIGIFDNEYGGVLDKVLIQPRIEFKQTKLIYDLLYEKIPFAIVSLLFAAMIIVFVLFLRYRKEKMFLYTTLLLFLIIVYIGTIFSPYKPFTFNYIAPILWSAFPLFSILFLMLYQSSYRIYLSEYNRIIIPAMIIIAIAMLLSYRWSNIGPALAILTDILFIPYFIFIVYRLNKIKPDKIKCIVLNSLVLLNKSVAILETILYLKGNRYALILLTFYTPFFGLIYVLLSVRDFQKKWTELNILYNKLKKPLKENSTLSITEDTEEKLKRIIIFVNENFTSDISREGLAASVDMNANYMSRLFKVYTGLKINEYITKLRIEESAKMLKEKNNKIIDIAFSIGYDNLVSFNRSFKSIMGITPSEFRNSCDLQSY